MRKQVQRTVSGCFAALRKLRSNRRSVPVSVYQKLVTALVLSRLHGLRERHSDWNPGFPVSSSPICVQRRCPIRRWSSALRPHHWDAREPSLTVRVWAHTIQAGDVDLQIVAWIGSAVLGRRPYPRRWHA